MSEGKFTQYQGNMFISHYYKIYFPAFILAMVISIFFGDLFISSIVGIPTASVLSNNPQSQGQILIHTFLSIGILSPIFVILLADMEIRKLDLSYIHEKTKMNIRMSIIMLVIGLGFFFLFSTLIKYLFALQFGNYFVISSLNNPGSPDYNVVFAADIVRVTKTPQIYSYLIITAFVLTYLSVEFVLRGLIANDAKAFRLGIAGGVVLPAIMQGVVFTYGILIFQSPAQYLISFLIFFFLGFFAGLIYWKTGRFTFTAIYSILAFLLQPGSSFQLNFLSGLPKFLGKYNPYDKIQTTSELIGVYMGYVNVSLIIIAPILALMAYSDVWKTLKEIATGVKQYYVGIGIVAVSFILIDLIFSFFTSSQNPLGAIVGFIIALVVVGLVLNYVIKVLPAPTSPLDISRQLDLLSPNERYPVDVRADIQYLDSEKPWWYNSTLVGVLISLAYIYLLFVAGALRQMELLDFEEKVRYVIFFGILPSILFGFGSFFTIRAIEKGYFFQKPWRRRLIQSMQFLFVVNLYIWARSAAITTFSWSVVPLFVGFAITIWPPEIENSIRDLSLGFTRNRLATFRWVKFSPGSFSDYAPILKNSQIEQVAIGAYISSALLGRADEWELIEELRGTSEEQRLIGIALSLGIIKGKSAEGALADLLKSESLEVKKAAFWALGKVGSPRVLPYMISVLESSPSESLVEIAEASILRIDPDFPLAGLRDNLTLVI